MLLTVSAQHLLNGLELMRPLNEKDLVDIPKNVRDEIEFKFATRVDEVLDWALEGGHPGKSMSPTQAAAQA